MFNQHKYVVRFTRHFISDHLKGIEVPASVGFGTLEGAQEYVDFLRRAEAEDYVPLHIRVEENRNS